MIFMDNMKEKRKINVLFVIIHMEMGGSEHLVWDLIRNLDRSVFRPHVAWFYQEKPLQEFLDLDVPLFFIPKIKRLDLSVMGKLSGIIKDNEINVVNAHHYLSLVYSFYGCKLKSRSKLIYTEHSEWEVQAISGKWLFVGRRLLRYTDAVVGISSKVTKCLQDTFRLPENKICTIVNGVDCTMFSVAHNTEQYKIKYGLERDDFVLGIVANLKKNKNHIFLLKAFQKLRQRNNNLKLLIIGQGFKGDPEGSEEDIRNFITSAGLESSALLLGGRTDVPDLLKALDIFCLTSCKEGLPISLIEAMATGLPVIGTNVEGIQDVIIPHSNGYLVELNDEEQLVQALESLIEDSSLRHEFGGMSRQLASQNYAFENCLRQYQSLFSSDRYSMVR
ncbi:Glycosyltransferase involved in cell wall bisynthesis [Candidatus Electrothrix marina]|uniref:Glycosyltransferase involved in cell wall bisynthesis n=1 Tax=Candidatus Electrothrix marina TaxID=1859130 RepID=A0A3S3UFF2_9BACT|nr:Glycosyltransferase involved in cell wall bisynthesis [Candidatus Electrothrix marina]